MIKTSLIDIFVLAAILSTCTKEGSPARTEYDDIFAIVAPPPSIACVENGVKAAAVAFRHLPDAVKVAQNDSNKQRNFMREAQERFYYLAWYKIQVAEFVRPTKVWSTLKTDSESIMKRFHYTRINVWLEGLEEFLFPKWISKAKNFNRYEKWLIGCSICQEETWEIFKQAINDKYGNSTKEGTIALAKAISDLYSEVSSEIIYYGAMSLKVPETDGEITDLCSVVGDLTQGTKPHFILYGIIRSKDACETFKVITERFTNENSSVTMTGVENSIMKVHRFTENTNLVTFFATCPSLITSEKLKKNLTSLIQTHVLNLESDLKIYFEVN